MLITLRHNGSMYIFQIIADCFCELPLIAREMNKSAYQERWQNQYYKLLKTLQSLILYFRVPLGMYFQNITSISEFLLA